MDAFRLDTGTTAANDPACGAYEAVIDVLLFDETFVVIDEVFVVMDCRTAVGVTARYLVKPIEKGEYDYLFNSSHT